MHTRANNPAESRDDWSTINRRAFLKVSGVLASAAAGAAIFTRGKRAEADVSTGQYDHDPVDTDPDVKMLYSVCLMCHSGCGIRCKVKDGALLKIDGNPYHPNGTTFEERLPYTTDPGGTVSANPDGQGKSYAGKQVRTVMGNICPKGQAGIEQVYNPYRVKQPLRRVGPRGSNEWVAISWDEALDEIVGVSTSPLGLTNLAAARDFNTDAGEFSDLGLKVNTIVSSVGRMEHGNKECNDRFFKNGLKTVNKRLDHTSICEASHHVAGDLLGQTHLKADLLNTKYLVLFGTSPLEANFPMVAFSRKLIEFKKQGGKLIVVDPRYSASASKADRWIAPKPGTDAAIAWGMIRHMVDNGYYDKKFMKNANSAAAADDYPGGSTTYSDATWLVRRDTGAYLKGDEGGLGGGSADYVCLVSGTPTPFSESGSAVNGDLFGEAINVSGILCDTVFQLIVNRARKRSVEDWAKIADVDADDVRAMAADLWSAAPAGAVDFYRGVVQHGNGVYTGMSLLYLNLLIGNFDRVGGVSKGGGHWHEDGSKSGQLPISENGNTNDVSGAPSGASGVLMSRAGSSYFGSDEHSAYGYDPGRHPKRPWFPKAFHGNWQEVEAGIDSGYPYPCSVLFIYSGNPAYSAPGAAANATRIYKDTGKLGLFVSIDVEINETNVHADYILPDTTYLEKWSSPHLAPTILTAGSGFRQPVVGQVWDGTKYVDIAGLDRKTLVGYLNAASASGANYAWSPVPYYKPIFPQTRLPEDIYCDLARRLGQQLGISGGWLPGFGPSAFVTADDVTGSTALQTAWDWARRLGTNVARGDSYPGSEVPGANDAERLAYVLERGGRFEDGTGYADDSYLTHMRNKRFTFYAESLAVTKRSDRNERFDGLGKYTPAYVDWTGEAVGDDSFPFNLITWKPVQHTQSRTALCPTLMGLEPENAVYVNAQDAAEKGIKTGDLIRLTSATSPTTGVTGKALVTEGIRRGVVGASNSFGHWQLHSVAPRINGSFDGFDPSRGTGVQINPIQRLDPKLGNVCVQDVVGGSASFYDTRVDIQKV